jgi:hypothetical protein
MIHIPTDNGPLYLNLDHVAAVRILEPMGRWDFEIVTRSGDLMVATLTDPSDDQIQEIQAALSGEDA